MVQTRESEPRLGMRQGKEACAVSILPKEKLEQTVVDQIRERVLTEAKLEELVKLVNEELANASNGLRDRLDAIDTELREVKARLSYAHS